MDCVAGASSNLSLMDEDSVLLCIAAVAREKRVFEICLLCFDVVVEKRRLLIWLLGNA